MHMLMARCSHSTLFMQRENLHAPFASLREMAVAGVRYCCLAALADVSRPAFAQQMFAAILPDILLMVEEERHIEVLYAIGEALEVLLKLSYESLTDSAAVTAPVVACAALLPTTATVGGVTGTPHTSIVIPLEQLSDVFETVQVMIESARRRRQVVIDEITSNPDADEQEAERLKAELQPEEEFITHCVDAAGYCIKTHRAAAIPHIQAALLPYLLPYLAEDSAFSSAVRCAAICVCDDLIEHASPEANVLIASLVPHLLTAAVSADERLRQTAVYGLGICAERGGEEFTPFVPEAMRALSFAATDAHARSHDFMCATENAVSALLKIARYRPTAPGVDTNAIMAGVLNKLPFRGDPIEARLVHGWMIEGLATGDALWLGEGSSRVPALLTAIANALIAHEANMEGATRDEEDEDEEDEDEEEEPLITAAHLTQLRAVFTAAVSSAQAPVLATIMRGMKKKQKKVLYSYGLTLAA